MILRFDKDCTLTINGRDYDTLLSEEKENLTLRVANYIRTHHDDQLLRSIVCTLIAESGVCDKDWIKSLEL